MSEPKKILVLENLPLGTTSLELTEMLTPLGQVSWSYIKNPEDGRRNQTGYAEMATEKEATKVIVKWNGAELKNHVLRVKYVPSNFDRATMGESWRSAKPPSQIKRPSKKTLEPTTTEPSIDSIDQKKDESPLTTASSPRIANQTVQYNRKDLVVLKPGMDLNSNYDEPNSRPNPFLNDVSNPPLKMVQTTSWFKNPFTWFTIIFFIVAITGISYAIYFFWKKM